MPAIALAASNFVSSPAFADLKKSGVEFLGSITGCKVKPKGTPHAEVWKKAPKLYFQYGDGIPGTGDFRRSNRSSGAVFDVITGGWILDAEQVFPRSERKVIEANFRQKCETTTGDLAFYVEVKSPSQDRGFVMLSDGNLYAAAMYGVDGGTSTNPVKLNVRPLGVTAQDGPAVRDTLSLQSSPVPLAAGVGLLGWFLFRR